MTPGVDAVVAATVTVVPATATPALQVKPFEPQVIGVGIVTVVSVKTKLV